MKFKNNTKWQKKSYKITIFGACAPYPRLIYWIASSILQGKEDDMSSKSGPFSWHAQVVKQSTWCKVGQYVDERTFYPSQS